MSIWMKVFCSGLFIGLTHGIFAMAAGLYIYEVLYWITFIIWFIVVQTFTKYTGFLK